MLERLKSILPRWNEMKAGLFGALLGVIIPSLAFGQATLMPNANQRYFNDAGQPVSSGKVFYYIPNTTTPKTVWQDAGETTPQSNPVSLDAGGKPQPGGQTFGSGCYTQQVVDVNGIQIWSAQTCSTGGGSSGGGASTQGTMVGTIIPWVSLTLPPLWLYTAGQAVSRTTYATLLTAITFSQAIICQSGIATISVPTNVSDAVPIGTPIEASCFAPGTTVASKASGILTMSNNATTTVSTTAVLFPWGNGDGATTFNVPDSRGRVIVGRDNMNGLIAGRLTTSFYAPSGTVNPDAINAAGGNQTATLSTSNAPPYTPSVASATTTLNGGTGQLVQGGTGGTVNIGGAGSGGTLVGPAPSTVVTMNAQGGTSAPFSLVQPSLTADYIIKALPDSPITGPGVTQLGGMTGVIACGGGLTCTGNVISDTLSGSALAYSYFGNTTASPGTPAYFAPASLPSKATPGASDVVMIADASTGALEKTTVSALTNSGGGGGRIRLSAPTTFFVGPPGTAINQAGCGLASGASACATRGYLYNILASNYDFGNQTVTVQIADGTYTDSLQASGSIILGQAGPSGLVFTGNCTTPTNVLIQPAASAGYTYSADGGTSFRIQCQKLDQTTGVRASASNDMTVAGHGSRLYMGNPSLFGVRADMVYGCNVNPYNTFTIANQAYLEVDNDFTIDVSACQVATPGTPTSGSAVIAVPSTTNIVRYLGIVATGIPNDAYVNSIVTNTSVTIACLVTSPCQATSSPGSETITFTGGGQAFMDWDSSQVFYITNGDPSFSIIGTLAGFPFYTSGWFFVNDQSLANAQAITWINPGQGRGACSATENLSITNTNFQGIPYLPCNALQPLASPSSTVVAGSSTFTVSSATGIKLGMIATDVVAPTATWTAGATTMVVSSGTGILAGAKVTGPGVLTGAIVTNVAGTTITVGGCGGGPRCVTNSPLYISEAGVTVEFSNGLFSGGSAVTGISGTTITISDTIKTSGTAGNVWFQGLVSNFSLYK